MFLGLLDPCVMLSSEDLETSDFPDVTLVSEGNRLNDAHRVILYSVTLPKMSTRSNSKFVAASVTEFLSVWSLGGEASLNLTTINGHAKIKFNCTLGHPSGLYSLPPSPRQPRHCGPAERERPTPGSKDCCFSINFNPFLISHCFSN